MTNQEIFDTVARHLLTQKKECRSDSSGGCRYRHGYLRCAIGVLIPDDVYDKAIEGIPVNGFFGKYRHNVPAILKVYDWFKLTFTVEQRVFLTELQNIHDDESAEMWKAELAHFAREFDLNSDVLEENYP